LPSNGIIEDTAYSISSPMMRLMFGTPPANETARSASLEARVARRKKVWAGDKTARYFKASIPTGKEEGDGNKVKGGKIVGMAVWHVYTLDTEKGVRDPWPKSSGEYPPRANLKLCEHYFKTLTLHRLTILGERAHWLLANLVVDPAFQQMGVGRCLVESVQVDVDKEGLSAGSMRHRLGCNCTGSWGGRRSKLAHLTWGRGVER
jgi:hypothetical protein